MKFTVVLYIISVLTGQPVVVNKSEIYTNIKYENKLACQKDMNDLSKQVNDVISETVDNGRYTIFVCKEITNK